MELKVIDNDIKLPLNDETKNQDQKCHICNRFVKTNIVVHYLEQHNQKVKIEGKNVNVEKINRVKKNLTCNKIKKLLEALVKSIF